MNRRQADNVRHIGPFSLVRLPAHGKVFIQPTGGLEGGPMPLADFLREVGPWEEIGAGDEEKIQRFYAAHF